MFFDDLIYHTSLRKAEKTRAKELNKNATIICEFFDNILGPMGWESEDMKQMEPFIMTLIKISKPKSDFDMHNPMPDLCSDEIYLQLFRMLNREFTLDNADEIYACLQLLYILVRFVIPTKNMCAHYLTWFELQVMSHIYILREESPKYDKLNDWAIAIMHFFSVIWRRY